MDCNNSAKDRSQNTFLYKMAKLIRALTVPPVMVTALLLLLFFGDDVFPTVLDFILALILLAIVPVLAYVAQKLLPGWKNGGQKAQRKLAFIFSFLAALYRVWPATITPSPSMTMGTLKPNCLMDSAKILAMNTKLAI
jgi:hypothetical protein